MKVLVTEVSPSAHGVGHQECASVSFLDHANQRVGVSVRVCHEIGKEPVLSIHAPSFGLVARKKRTL